MSVLRDKTGHANIRHVILTLIIISGLAAAFLYYPPVFTRSAEELTQGDITISDSTGNPVSSAIGISGSGISGGYKENVNFIKWERVPNGIIYFNAFSIKNVSVKFRLGGDSRNSRVILENYGASMPKDLNEPAPGTPLKYVQVSALNLSFVEAEISIQYNASELGDIDENTLSIYHYDNARNEWSKLKTTVDVKNDILTASVDSLSIFAVSARLPGQIDIRDTRSAQIRSVIKTFDDSRNLKKSARSSSLVAHDIPPGGELEVDAIATRNVALRLKVNAAIGGEVILDDYGRKNPVSVPLPGRPVKFVEIGVQGISFSSAEVSVRYREAELNGVSENSLVIYHWNLTYWEALDTTVDAVNNILKASTTTLSPFAVSGSIGGPDRILVATNRYVILDDPVDSAGGGNASSAYALPFTGEWGNKNIWGGNQTTVGVSTLFIDNNGKAISGRIVNFTIYDPNNSIAAAGSNVTDTSGLAHFYKDMDNASFYGVWKVKAESGGVSSNTSFIYNWWGCAWGTSGQCGGQHSGKSPADTGSATANSPYTVSWERTTSANSAHNTGIHLSGWADDYCTVCHQSYDGNPTTINIEGGTAKDFFVNDVHSNISCTNAACHDPNGTSAWNDHNTGSIILGSCDNCHDRTDISKKSTLNGAVSSYSNGSGTYDKYHTPNATVPCIICHGPMHNISKPDAAAGSQNNITEDSQCASCHKGYSKHNNSVNCTLCHSSDVHYIQVFGASTYVYTIGGSTYVFTTSPVRGDCTTCHQNSTFMDVLKSIPKAGNYTGRNAPQVPVPAVHSDDTRNGSKWNQIEPYWTNTSQIERCKYCHGETMHRTNALGRPSLFDGGNPVNGTISSTLTWCQQCHWQGSPDYSIMAAVFTEDNRTVPPEITGNATYGKVTSIGTAYVNHSSYAKDDEKCRICHGALASSQNITGFMHTVAVGTSGGVSGGGPGCLGCHNTSTPQNFTGMHYIDGGSFSKSTHANMNSNNASGYGINASCWACHNSTGTVVPDNTHPDRKTTPFICTDCHLANGSRAGAYNATIIYNHFRNGTGIKALANRTSDLASCIECHENVSGMLLPNNDNDTGSFAGDMISVTGGRTSTYHYGEAQLNFGKTKGSDDYCTYCHRNMTGEFNRTFTDTSNSSISNHSMRYNTSNPSCSLGQCHNSTVATLHGDGLIRSGMGNKSTYCLSCHGENTTTRAPNYSGITTATKSRHNNSINCEECHMNDGRDIHPVKYLQPEGIYNTSNSTAVNCVLCHQTGMAKFQTAPKISSRISHSEDYRNGSIWNMTEAYWTNTSPQSMCTYCHGDSRHDELALGLPANWSGANTVNSSITNNSNWCSGCHYQGYSSDVKNYNSMVQKFEGENLPVPPEISNHSSYAPYSKNGYFNHSISPDYSDLTCKACHGVFLPNGTKMDGFMHNVSTGTGSCTGCHFSYSFMSTSGAAAKFVNQSMYNSSAHGSLGCEDCHTKGHKNIGARKACEDCHAYQQDPINDMDRHNITGTPAQDVVNNTDCTSCHDARLYNNATAQYGYGKTYDCNYCHTYPDKMYS